MTPTVPATSTPTALATPRVEICDDCYDNDGDGLADHDDLQCTEAANGGGAGLGDPARGKALVGCAKAIRTAGGKLSTRWLGALQRCLGSVTTCVQTKPDDPQCLAKARLGCEKSFATIAAARTAVAPAITKACNVPELGLSALLDASGLGYDAKTTTCARYGVASLMSLDDLARCVTERHGCAAERLAGAQYPRASELLGLVSLDGGAFPCLGGMSDGGGAGVGAPTGKLLGKCAKTIARSGASLVRGRLALTRRCTAAALACVEQKPGDEACVAKASATCAGVAAKLPTLVAKLSAAVSKSCNPTLVDTATLLAPEGLGLGGLATMCAERGVPGLATIDDVTACLVRQHQCEADQLLETELPRVHELLDLVDGSLP